MQLTINSEISLLEAQVILEQQWKLNRFLILTLERQQRTLTQNKAIHLYFKMLAYELNTSGYDIKKTLRQDFEIQWNEASIKELIWKPVQTALFGTGSTKKLTTDQVSKVYDVIHDHLLTITVGEVDVQFPSKENKHNDQ